MSEAAFVAIVLLGPLCAAPLVFILGEVIVQIINAWRNGN